jgi:serine/threonine protein kinase
MWDYETDKVTGSAFQVNDKVFARKVLHVFDPKELKNEIRAVLKLCTPGSHKNIVSVFNEPTPVGASLYFFDMELCDLNLDNFIHGIIPPGVPYFAVHLPPRLRQAQLWHIMEDVTSGVAFIHSHVEVHRDIKPANSTYPFFVSSY